jgi:hypothetical protein
MAEMQPLRLIAIAIVLLGVSVFLWADHDSHSASDTLTRSVPTLCLIGASVLRIAHRQGAGRLTATFD